MGTRATYTFEKDNADQTISCYIHYDGYPSGAAVYFWKMHQHQHYKGGWADSFIKANIEAEIRFNPNASDPLYQYYFDKDAILTVKERDLDDSEEMLTIFTGHYIDFINKNQNECLVELDDYEPIYLLDTQVKQALAISSDTIALSKIKLILDALYQAAASQEVQDCEKLALVAAEYARLKQLSQA